MTIKGPRCLSMYLFIAVYILNSNVFLHAKSIINKRQKIEKAKVINKDKGLYCNERIMLPSNNE